MKTFKFILLMANLVEAFQSIDAHHNVSYAHDVEYFLQHLLIDEIIQNRLISLIGAQASEDFHASNKLKRNVDSKNTRRTLNLSELARPSCRIRIRACSEHWAIRKQERLIWNKQI